MGRTGSSLTAALVAGASIGVVQGCGLLADLGSYQSGPSVEAGVDTGAGGEGGKDGSGGGGAGGGAGGGGGGGGDAGSDAPSGPSWCDLNAPDGAAFCDDFDRESALTPHWTEARPLSASASFDQQIFTSPPQSLHVVSDASTANSTVDICYNAVLGDGGPVSFAIAFDVNVDDAAEQAQAGIARIEIAGPPSYKASLFVNSTGGLSFDQEFDLADGGVKDKSFSSGVELPIGTWSRVLYTVTLVTDAGTAEVVLADGGVPGTAALESGDPVGTIRFCVAQHVLGGADLHFDNVTLVVGGQ